MKDEILSHYKYIFKGHGDYTPFMDLIDLEEGRLPRKHS